ncbi:alpha/beta fold hydrolase [Acinetobacter radioresistens]|uniref:alpha/beta fold hydrolase n=1 Tax=Acinetobacter radioresistens TaxID=40216 RepID=UPI0009464F78|nr:alpha/beta hydrolase [Acinetobacter radioresistens]
MEFDSFETKYIPYNGKQLTVHITGEVNHKNTIVLIHGTGGTTLTHFNHIFPMLSVQQQVVAIDLLHKESDIFELDDYFQQVKFVLDTLLPRKEVTLVGYSLGAVISTYTAAKLKGRINKLVTLCGWLKTTSTQKFYHEILEDLYRENSVALAKHITLNAFSEAYLTGLPSEQIQFITTFMKVDDTYIKQNNLNNSVDLTEIVGEVTAETLVISCSDDKLVPVYQCKLLYAGIENSRYAEIKAGHAINSEASARTVQLINNFNQNNDYYPKGSIISTELA